MSNLNLLKAKDKDDIIESLRLKAKNYGWKNTYPDIFRKFYRKQNADLHESVISTYEVFRKIEEIFDIKSKLIHKDGGDYAVKLTVGEEIIICSFNRYYDDANYDDEEYWSPLDNLSTEQLLNLSDEYLLR